MTMTGRNPAPGYSGSGSSDEAELEDERAVPFDAFLKWLSVGARARNDTAWLEWYEGWLRDMPEGDGREAYLKMSRADYEARMGETVDEHMDRTRKAMLDMITERNRARALDKLTKLHVEEATNEQIMVENFKIFQREYVDMTVSRSC